MAKRACQIPLLPVLGGGLFVTALGLSVWLCLASGSPPAEPTLTTYAAANVQSFVLPEGSGGGEGARVFQNIRRQPDAITAEYGCVNFNNDALRVKIVLPYEDLETYRRDYGYTRKELDDLLVWQRQALNEAFQTATKNRSTQAELDRTSEGIKQEYFRRHRELLMTRGFRFLSPTLLAPDIPAIVRRNVVPLRPLALSLNQMAESGDYDTDAIIGANLALVQTALFYEVIPSEQNGRVSGGMQPPLLTLAAGKGDCDSKTALLAATLLSWDNIRLVGVGVPNHYLLGILRNPAKGEMFVEYEGLHYVLVEPAGPGWLPPGSVGRNTLDLLNAGDGVMIEPLTAL